MSNQPDHHVKPGDLIKADAFNDLVDRVATLEAFMSTFVGLRITSLDPATGPYEVGSQLIINGSNFDISVGGSRIFVDGQFVLPKPSSTDTRILIDIPTIANLTEAGKLVQLLVRNRTSEVSRSLNVRPRIDPLNGLVDIQWQRTDPTVIRPNQTTRFFYQALSHVNRPAGFTAKPIINFPAGLPIASGLDAQRFIEQIQDAFSLRTVNDDILPALTLDPSNPTPIPFVMRLDFPNLSDNNALNNVNFTLTMGLEAEGRSWSSDEEHFTVGQQVEQPDDTMTLTVKTVTPGSVDLTNNNISVPANSHSIALTLSVRFTVDGTYDFLRPDDIGGWSIALAPATLPYYTITGVNGSITKLPVFVISSPAPSATPVQMVVGYQRRGNNQKQTITLHLSLVP